jgi:hypothetical protein
MAIEDEAAVALDFPPPDTTNADDDDPNDPGEDDDRDDDDGDDGDDEEAVAELDFSYVTNSRRNVCQTTTASPALAIDSAMFSSRVVTKIVRRPLVIASRGSMNLANAFPFWARESDF